MKTSLIGTVWRTSPCLIGQACNYSKILPVKEIGLIRFAHNKASSMSVSEAFQTHGVVPDVVSVAPKQLIQISFGAVSVQLGNELTPTQVKAKPTSLTWPSQPDKLYTLIMTDPDAPSRADPKFREWHHWLVANIKGNDVAGGDTLSDYIGSGPPPDTGLHRYVYLVYEQTSTINDKEHGKLTNTSADNRGGWKAATFANKHKMGDPLAGNFYLSQFDDYVPELYKQLGA